MKLFRSNYKAIFQQEQMNAAQLQHVSAEGGHSMKASSKSDGINHKKVQRDAGRHVSSLGAVASACPTQITPQSFRHINGDKQNRGGTQ